MALMLLIAVLIGAGVAVGVAVGLAGWKIGRRDYSKLRDRLNWLEQQTAQISRSEATIARDSMQAEQWAEYQPTKDRLQKFSVFLNRNFQHEMRMAQLHQPPVNFLDVAQNLLLTQLGRSASGAGGGQAA